MRCRYILRDNKTCSVLHEPCDREHDRCPIAIASAHPFETERTLVPIKREITKKDGSKHDEYYYHLAVPKAWVEKMRIKKDTPSSKRRVKILYDGIIKILPTDEEMKNE